MKKLAAAICMAVCICNIGLASDCAARPAIAIENETVQKDTITYTVSSNEPLAGMLICTVYDANGALSGISVTKSPDAQTHWTIDVNTGLEKGMSKMLFWNAAGGIHPWVEGSSSTWDKSAAKTDLEHLTTSSTIGDLLDHPAFYGFAEQILP